MVAQATAGNVFFILLWMLATVALLVVGYVVVTRLRSWLRGSEGETSPAGFTLSDLRKLHAEGQMTDEEFEKAKAKAVQAARAMMEKRPKKQQAAGDGGPKFPDVGAG